MAIFGALQTSRFFFYMYRSRIVLREPIDKNPYQVTPQDYLGSIDQLSRYGSAPGYIECMK